jgi:hypothetical protein
MSTESSPNEKKIDYVNGFENKVENTKKPYSLVFMGLTCANNQDKNISCKFIFKFHIARLWTCRGRGRVGTWSIPSPLG